MVCQTSVFADLHGREILTLTLRTQVVAVGVKTVGAGGDEEVQSAKSHATSLSDVCI